MNIKLTNTNAKLRKEEKFNPHLVDFAVKNRIKVDIEKLQRLIR